MVKAEADQRDVRDMSNSKHELRVGHVVDSKRDSDGFPRCRVPHLPEIEFIHADLCDRHNVSNAKLDSLHNVLVSSLNCSTIGSHESVLLVTTVGTYCVSFTRSRLRPTAFIRHNKQ